MVRVIFISTSCFILILGFQNCSNVDFATLSGGQMKAAAGEDAVGSILVEGGIAESDPLEDAVGSVLVEGGNAEGAPLVLVLDEDSIDNGNQFSSSDINDDIPAIGSRLILRYFASHVGLTLNLSLGQDGDEGMFVITNPPASWAQAGPTTNGISNFFLAGPGLGSADKNGNRETLLDNIPAQPVRSSHVQGLLGRAICAIVYDSDISYDKGKATANLQGENLGVVAFEILNLAGSSSIQVKILNASLVCGSVGYSEK